MYAIKERTSSSSQFDAKSQIIPCQWSARPFAETPLRIARATAASVQAPIPFVGWEEMLRDHLVPAGAQLVFLAPSPLP